MRPAFVKGLLDKQRTKKQDALRKDITKLIFKFSIFSILWKTKFFAFETSTPSLLVFDREKSPNFRGSI
jgi:hypothetical protein